MKNLIYHLERAARSNKINTDDAELIRIMIRKYKRKLNRSVRLKCNVELAKESR